MPNALINASRKSVFEMSTEEGMICNSRIAKCELKYYIWV